VVTAAAAAAAAAEAETAAPAGDTALSAGGGWKHVEWVLGQVPLRSPLIFEVDRST
jgi:hypothetical protein